MSFPEIEYPDDADVYPVNEVIVDPAQQAHNIYIQNQFDAIQPKAAQILVVDGWIELNGYFLSQETLDELRFLALY